MPQAGGIGGSGLGLSIVERTACLHGGEFRLERRVGGGLSATLILPRNS
jgi:two-component system osmolarity sensor histidine kinase EnvZ